MYSGDEYYGDEITIPLHRPTTAPRLSFDAWMAKLDKIVWGRVGCSIHDLEDFDFQSAYKDGYTPRKFFNEEIAPEIGED